ncbi:MAG: hypothetical protein ACYTG7_04325 [Planctomycetota bacterium]
MKTQAPRRMYLSIRVLNSAPRGGRPPLRCAARAQTSRGGSRTNMQRDWSLVAHARAPKSPSPK